MTATHDTSMRIALITLGCPKNLVDAEVMLGLLDAAGHALVGTPEDADLAIVNTCSFIEAAIEESASVIEGCLELKRSGRLKHVLVAGCLPQRFGEQTLDMFPAVDAVVGCSDVPRIVELVAELGSGRRVIAVHDPEFLYDHTTPRALGTPAHLAYVKIAEGCDNRCAYCMIPSIRGRLRSRDVGSVVEEAHALAAAGVRELNLIAQDTTAYGTDVASVTRLPELLAELESVEVDWIRLLYTHPAHLDDAVLDAVAASDRVVPYMDIPIQHVSDPILRAMGRRTDGAHVRRLLERVRERVAGVTIRSSVIVGFPGEGREEFEELRSFVASGAIDRLGIFEYSPESGTRAATLDGRVPRETVSARADELAAVAERLAASAGRAASGRRMRVLVDRSDRDGIESRHAGQAWELDGVVLLPPDEGVAAGDMIPALITGARGFDLTAVPLTGDGETA